jgi:hypothetical protein
MVTKLFLYTFESGFMYITLVFDLLTRKSKCNFHFPFGLKKTLRDIDNISMSIPSDKMMSTIIFNIINIPPKKLLKLSALYWLHCFFN